MIAMTTSSSTGVNPTSLSKTVHKTLLRIERKRKRTGRLPRNTMIATCFLASYKCASSSAIAVLGEFPQKMGIAAQTISEKQRANGDKSKTHLGEVFEYATFAVSRSLSRAFHQFRSLVEMGGLMRLGSALL